MQIAKTTTGEGSVWDVAFSADPQQRYLYVADGQDKTVWELQRDSLAPVSRFGDGGRYPGMFYGLDRVAVDSKGNVYTGETYEGKRVQKFNYKGLGPAQPMN
jgi:DNA-binding beta-propeller fold protein YncE